MVYLVSRREAAETGKPLDPAISSRYSIDRGACSDEERAQLVELERVLISGDAKIFFRLLSRIVRSGRAARPAED